MEIRNNINNLSFQAQVPKILKNQLRNEALDMGSKAIKAVNKQIREVEKWGDRNSTLVSPSMMSIAKFKRSAEINLYNNSISKIQTVGLPQKSSLLDTFMSLKEKDIINAEKQIQENLEEAQMDLIWKALNNRKLMKEITGSTNPSDEILGAAIEKMSEEQINKLRFSVEKK